MHKFTYTPEPDNPYDHATVILETRTVELAKVLETMEYYLRATGFNFEGHLDIVEDEAKPKICGVDIDSIQTSPSPPPRTDLDRWTEDGLDSGEIVPSSDPE